MTPVRDYTRRVYLPETVLEAALARIRRLYTEFPEILVNFSGGKDSTVTLNLTLQVAQELDRLPVKVLFIDQEAEWESVITYIRAVMADPRIEPWWFQGPFRIFNASSSTDDWLTCWGEGQTWLRAKELQSIHENQTGTDRFKDLFIALPRLYLGRTPYAQLAGVRCEESPGRQRGLTSYATYKEITWGHVDCKRDNQYTFYPLYDWRWQDIWKAIHDHGWPYCSLYDAMYQYGIPFQQMRVSNVHHETALKSLTFMQDLEPVMWDKVVSRVASVNTVKQLASAYTVPKELPWMFNSWQEYRDYLLDNLILDPTIHAIFTKQFRQWEDYYLPEALPALHKLEIAAILVNDYHMTKYDTFQAAHASDLRAAGTRNQSHDHFNPGTASTRAVG